MAKYDFSGLEDRDILAVWLLSQTQDGKTDEVEFVKLLDQRREQVKQEVITLSTELEKLEAVDKISNKDFFRQAAIYCLSNEENCSMAQASEIYEKAEQERDKEDTSDMGKIVKALQGPKYASPKDIVKADEEEQKEKGEQTEELIWTTTGAPVGPDGEKVERIIGIEKKEVEIISPWEYEGNLKLERLRKKYKKEVK